jgi:serine/threonine-protein kinase MRCK
MLPIERLNLLEKLFVPAATNTKSLIDNYNKLSIDTLLDSLVALYDDCCNSTLKRDKIISNFIDYGINYLSINF